MKDLVHRLVDALEFEHQYAENWRDYRGIDGSDEFDPLIAEARAAIAAPVSQEEWTTKMTELISNWGDELVALIRDDGDESPCEKAFDVMDAHLRSHPAFVPEGFALICTKIDDKLLATAISKSHGSGEYRYVAQEVIAQYLLAASGGADHG